MMYATKYVPICAEEEAGVVLPVVPPPPAPDLNGGLVAYWDFEEAVGNFKNRVNPAVHELSVQGTVSRLSGGVGGGSCITNYSTGAVQTPYYADLVLHNRNWSFQVWVKPSTLQYTAIAAKKHQGIVDYAFFLQLHEAALGYVKFFTPTSDVQISLPALTLQVWHHFVFTYSLAELRLNFFLNGTLIGSRNNVQIAIDSGTGAFQISQEVLGVPVSNISVDKVGLWTQTRTAHEIVLLYNHGLGWLPPAP